MYKFLLEMFWICYKMSEWTWISFQFPIQFSIINHKYDSQQKIEERHKNIVKSNKVNSNVEHTRIINHKTNNPYFHETILLNSKKKRNILKK